MTSVILFSEDTLIEQAARRIIAVQNPNLVVSNAMGRRGFSYLQTRINEIRKSSPSLTFLIFLDGDELGNICPSDAIEDWFQSRKPKNIHVRFAFHEVESWLLADRQNIAAFLHVSIDKVPIVDDKTPNTKELLVKVARGSRSREILEDLVPRKGFSAAVGAAYNARVSEFIQKSWDVRSASMGNQSLARACKCVAELV